jgi:hypothetical protein
MKKLMYVLSAIALASIFVVSCEKKPKPDLNKVTEDGFYVAGAATGSTEITAEYGMSAGINEAAEQSAREGMYEKYIVLEGGKDFELLYHAAGKETRYSAALEDITIDPESSEIYDANPAIPIKKGILQTGESAPAMRVATTGLYHIVLDLNTSGDLDNAGGAQIIVAPVEWGVRGGMNSWGFTAFPAPTYSNDGFTMTLETQKLAAGAEFKFAYASSWKITLDDAGKVKANTNLGLNQTQDGLAQGGGNIKVETAGEYTVTLTFKLAAGAVGKSFSYTTVCTKESTTPTTMYMIGNDFGDWKWTSDKVVTMNQFHSQEGQFWAVRYMTTTTQFKFCAEKAWEGDFATPKTGEQSVTGATEDGGNLIVSRDGLYTINVDVVNGRVVVEPAVIVGMNTPFKNPDWSMDCADAIFTNNTDGTTSYVVAEDGDMRVFVKSSMITGFDWWHAEFIIKDGKIVYRGTGGDPEAIALKAGQTVTFDFNNEAGSIK